MNTARMLLKHDIAYQAIHKDSRSPWLSFSLRSSRQSGPGTRSYIPGKRDWRSTTHKYLKTGKW